MFDELDRLLLGDAEEEEVFEELVRLRTAGVTEAACMAHAVELSGREGLSAAQRERLEQFVDGTLPETQEVEFDGRRYWTFLLHSHPPDAPQWLEVVHLREVGRSAQAICVQVEERLLADRAELADLAGRRRGSLLFAGRTDGENRLAEITNRLRPLLERVPVFRQRGARDRLDKLDSYLTLTLEARGFLRPDGGSGDWVLEAPRRAVDALLLRWESERQRDEKMARVERLAIPALGR